MPLVRKGLKFSKAIHAHVSFWTEHADSFRKKKKNTPISSNAANSLHQGWKVIFNGPNPLLPEAPKYPVTIPTTPWMFSEYDMFVGLGKFSII